MCKVQLHKKAAKVRRARPPSQPKRANRLGIARVPAPMAALAKLNMAWLSVVVRTADDVTGDAYEQEDQLIIISPEQLYHSYLATTRFFAC